MANRGSIGFLGAGTIKYTFMAPFSRATHPLGEMARTILILGVTSLFFDLELTDAIHLGALAILALCSISLVGFGMVAAAIPLFSPEKGSGSPLTSARSRRPSWAPTTTSPFCRSGCTGWPASHASTTPCAACARDADRWSEVHLAPERHLAAAGDGRLHPPKRTGGVEAERIDIILWSFRPRPAAVLAAQSNHGRHPSRPKHGAAIERGRIYVAPPDHYLLVKAGFIAMTQGPREYRRRPAVDPLFRSAALAYGSRVVGVVLSGSLDDGATGLVSDKAEGGVALVRDPAEALCDPMPQSAIQTGAVDRILPVGRNAAEIARVSVTPVTGKDRAMSRERELETRIAEADPAFVREELQLGTPASLGCPECGGTLWEMREGPLTRFRRRVGQACTARTLLDEQAEVLEDALWAAVRNLEEPASLRRRLMARAAENGHPLSFERYRDRVGDATRRAEVVRRFLLSEFADAAPEPSWATVAEPITDRSLSS